MILGIGWIRLMPIVGQGFDRLAMAQERISALLTDHRPALPRSPQFGDRGGGGAADPKIMRSFCPVPHARFAGQSKIGINDSSTFIWEE